MSPCTAYMCDSTTEMTGKSVEYPVTVNSFPSNELIIESFVYNFIAKAQHETKQEIHATEKILFFKIKQNNMENKRKETNIKNIQIISKKFSIKKQNNDETEEIKIGFLRPSSRRPCKCSSS